MDAKLFHFALFLATTALDIQSGRNMCDKGSVWNVTVMKCIPHSNLEDRARSAMVNKSCNSGFQFDESRSQCIDIDECNQGKTPCRVSEYCVNVDGGYKCKMKNFCGQGYQLNMTTNQCEDMDECANGMGNCVRGSICQNVPGSFICRPECPSEKKYYWNGGCNLCPEGFRFNRTTKECFDFDECEDPYRPMCEPYKEKCVSTPGLSRCVTSCSGGTRMVNGRCYDIDECTTRVHNCTSNTKCVNLFGTFLCDTPYCETNEIFIADKNACECRPGYQMNIYSGECADIDECARKPRPCGIHGGCINNAGNFTCVCHDGFRLVENVCEDIDECRIFVGICGSLRCKNILGGYQCTCPDGLRRNEYDICEDINECTEIPGACNVSTLGIGGTYRCVNLHGSFKCLRTQCPSEYHPSFDGRHGRRCELRNANCSLESSNECVQVLPQYISTSVIEIPRTNLIPQKIIDIPHGLSLFDHYHIQIMMRKSVYTRTQHDIEIDNLLMLTHDDEQERSSLFLTQTLRGPAEIVCDVFLKYSHESHTRIHSLYQYHIIVNDDVL